MPPGFPTHVFLFVALGASCSAPTQTIPGQESAASGRLTAIANMSRPRAAHSATLLRDGRVLIAGGLDAAGATAELFDPRTRTFAATPMLASARVSHTATLLADGRVLVAGGYDGTYLSSTEIYDPERNEFTRGPAMLEPRMGHLAIPLADGRVLFVGGQTSATRFLASAEIYDPATNSFVATGPMSAPRESHVGALLPDGTALIVGGHNGRHESITLYATSELYDPKTGRFAPSGTMHRRRHKHAAVSLADGRVLVTGGADERDDQGQYRDAELFDSRTGTFSDAGLMNRPRYKHEGAMVVLPDGSVLLGGGNGAAEVYDPKSKAFSVVPSSSVMAGSFSTATLLHDGSVLITGGYGNGTGPRSSVWLYTP